jgi:hypothetical protein
MSERFIVLSSHETALYSGQERPHPASLPVSFPRRYRREQAFGLWPTHWSDTVDFPVGVPMIGDRLSLCVQRDQEATLTKVAS